MRQKICQGNFALKLSFCCRGSPRHPARRNAAVTVVLYHMLFLIFIDSTINFDTFTGILVVVPAGRFVQDRRKASDNSALGSVGSSFRFSFVYLSGALILSAVDVCRCKSAAQLRLELFENKGCVMASLAKSSAFWLILCVIPFPFRHCFSPPSHISYHFAP